MIIRLFLTALTLIGAGVLRTFAYPIGAIGAGRAAGGQMSSSDAISTDSIVTMHFYSSIGAIIWIVAAVLIFWIWWKHLKRGWAALLAGMLVMIVAGQAPAFYSATDVTEAYGILPNHTAFWVPGTGDTKNNQSQTESEEFLRSNKVAGKFFIIPHVKLSGSTYMGWDKYIPTGRLIVVDRAPFFHEWTKAGRGTDAQSDQSFPCHSKDNIEVSAEMSLASSVTEDNAARFLFYFGVNPPSGDPATPEVIFTSVYQGRTLAQVMGSWGRGEIQSRVCRHVNAYTIEELARHGNDILNQIQDEAKTFFAGFGITIEYVGWAGGFGYPKEVRDAINTRFAAEHIAPVIETLREKATIDAISGWDRHLPGSVTLLGGISSWVTDFLGMAKTPPQAVAKP
jgi:hypothetical protein